MAQRTLKQALLGAGLSLAFLLLSIVAEDPIDAIERSITDMKYRVRGASRIDSSIVILYFDHDDIDALGGWPLKRTYYALLIDALRQLNVRAIGIDIAFTEPDVHGIEYDALLAEMIKRSGNVVLSGYFRSISDDAPSTAPSVRDSLPARLTVSSCEPFSVRIGTQLIRPIEPLLDATSRFGHTVLTDDFDVPIVIGTKYGVYVPAFAYSILLEALSRQDNQEDPLWRSSREAPLIAIPGKANGDVSLLHVGGAASLNMISIVEFLRAFDAFRFGEENLVEQVRSKIVLVGVVAEGRSSFVPSPFGGRLPSIGLHATFIHNALHQNFLRRSGAGSEYVLALLFGMISFMLLHLRKEALGGAVLLSVVVFYMIISFILFSSTGYLLPIARPVLVVLAISIGALLIRHRNVRATVESLGAEKDRVHRLLEEKESIVQRLESDLARLRESQNDQSRRRELAAEIEQYRAEILRLRVAQDDLTPFSRAGREVDDDRKVFAGIVYNPSGLMADVLAFVRKIADSDAAVLILGESGTGKELVSQAIHDHSRRRGKPFVIVNCGALAETLLESELFGHEKGAFTGAHREKAGRFELANGGTIFLDEIGETSEAFQVKLLRVLQDGTYERVGGTETMKTDIRIIAATNRDLRRAVVEKTFRQDLFYRLNVFTIDLPPLRDRKDDIPLLVEQFLAQETPPMKCSAVVMELLHRHAWPGNIRELQSVIKRASVLARTEGHEMLRVKDLPPELASGARSGIDIEGQVLDSLRHKKFSRSAISETADELGGLNRGTVAEYFRGYCLRTFSESQWDYRIAVNRIAALDDEAVRQRVARKLIEYLTNAVDQVDPSLPIERILELSKSKAKNLPQRYHPFLTAVVESYYRGEWRLEGKTDSSSPPD